MFPVNIINGLDLWRDTLRFKLTAIFNLLFILMLMIHLFKVDVNYIRRWAARWSDWLSTSARDLHVTF